MKLSDIKDPDSLTSPVELDGIELTVRSIDSTVYNDFIRASWLRNSIREDKPSDEELAQTDRMGAARLVVSWNLEDECTPENIVELLRKKRTLINKIYMAANDLGKPATAASESSGSGVSGDSGSGSQSAPAGKSPAKRTGTKSEKPAKS